MPTPYHERLEGRLTAEVGCFTIRRMENETKQYLEQIAKRMRERASETERVADKLEGIINGVEREDDSYYPFRFPFVLPFGTRFSYCWFLWGVAILAINNTLFCTQPLSP